MSNETFINVSLAECEISIEYITKHIEVLKLQIDAYRKKSNISNPSYITEREHFISYWTGVQSVWTQMRQSILLKNSVVEAPTHHQEYSFETGV